MARTIILAVCALTLLMAVQQVSAGGARQLNAEIKETFTDSSLPTRHLLDNNNLPPGTGASDTGSAIVSPTGNGSGVGGSGASGSGGATSTGRSQATNGAALAPGSIAPASG